MKVLIGVDPHKASVAVAAVDEAAGELLERASFPQDRAGLRALERWAKRFPERRWAMENARGLGRHLAGRLVAAGECVVDVPPKLSAKVRVLSTGNARKNDGLDALATALAASRNERLAAVDPEADSEVLRLLSERREDLVAERTRALNRLHGLLRDLLPGGVAGKLSADRAARILRSIRARGNASACLRRRLASEILRDVRTLDRKIVDLDGRIGAEVEASGTTLTEIFGVGPILAATILGTVGDVTRFPTKARFASYSGTAPVEASSGKVVRHRLSLGGNRKLNYALHMVATSQSRSGAPGGTYYRKKIDEGKSSKEALRCLKRRVCDAVFRSLVADSKAPSSSAA
ncbi:MAG: Mobile element protein [uncultured Rubrobacteraceae bacterium]|uniref:Mobile element protein n=1 Tax=uncultured Rubrobacteraceae bacterium TaxID=349277 RepID=A0A6J4QG73_9ACTN|nr:MAG: Mobile element protein [uncultured Rubrobacteraceae bacterium]